MLLVKTYPQVFARRSPCTQVATAALPERSADSLGGRKPVKVGAPQPRPEPTLPSRARHAAAPSRLRAPQLARAQPPSARLRDGCQAALGAVFLSVCVGAVVAAPGRAALPPEWQRIQEMDAAQKTAQRVLGGCLIESTQRLDDGLYAVRAGKCWVHVRVAADHETRVGPAVYSGRVVKTEGC